MAQMGHTIYGMKKKRPMSASEKEKVLSGLRQEQAQRMRGYRERALRLFPHVCARCGREFSGRRLKELTVHHKDHNHDNNPADGSNWELLCLYCHDFEHEKSGTAGHYSAKAEDYSPSPSIFTPFADSLNFPGLDSNTTSNDEKTDGK